MFDFFRKVSQSIFISANFHRTSNTASGIHLHLPKTYHITRRETTKMCRVTEEMFFYRCGHSLSYPLASDCQACEETRRKLTNEFHYSCPSCPGPEARVFSTSMKLSVPTSTLTTRSSTLSLSPLQSCGRLADVLPLDLKKQKFCHKQKMLSNSKRSRLHKDWLPRIGPISLIAKIYRLLSSQTLPETKSPNRRTHVLSVGAH
jgi:hypothetical protein